MTASHGAHGAAPAAEISTATALGPGPTLTARDISVYYPGQTRAALAAVRVDIGPQDLVVALGPSGCGKTTLLNVLAGFIVPSQGSVTLGNVPVRGPGADRAVVFQSNALLPWLDVAENIVFGLKLQGAAPQEQDAVAAHMIALVGLAGWGRRRIWELSGGMRQRVGLARALASASRVILLDEPFSALDPFTREQMQELLLDVWRQAGRGAFLITHDVEEALFLATEVLLMSPAPGRITERVRPDFGARYRAGEPTRSIKKDPAFIAMRERLLEGILRAPAPAADTPA